MKWVGLEQYSYLLSDPMFWKSISNTLIIWVISTVPMLLLALVIANALHNATRFRSFYRIAYFIPNITSVVADDHGVRLDLQQQLRPAERVPALDRARTRSNG